MTKTRWNPLSVNCGFHQFCASTRSHRQDFRTEFVASILFSMRKEDRNFRPTCLPKLRLLASELQILGSVSYEFLSADEAWTVSLTKEFLALTANHYERWEIFKDNLRLPRESLSEIYQPAFFSRIGLRYRNVIKRSVLGLDDADWSQLLQPPILGELAEPEVAPQIKQTRRDLILELEDIGQVRIRHGMVKIHGSDELVYVIDADYFTEQRTEVSDAITTLDRFNRESGRLFRWCITERLHDAMEPQPVE